MKLPGDILVPTKVNGVDSKPVRVASAGAVHKRLEQSAGKAGSSAAAESDVHLTGASRNLAAIEQSLRELPAVDELRVSTVRQRLASGDYKVDPQRVADRMLSMERDLGRAAPFDDSPLK
ncbi:MAG TPA: flagellar biosynthesis anti-sigma factor FlgM [Steroidobacteraceae bacterium]|nr:flagellar biosynthesis anti-sigma factor FlgM [Steroidobacteraceae bacterium]